MKVEVTLLNRESIVMEDVEAYVIGDTMVEFHHYIAGKTFLVSANIIAFFVDERSEVEV